MGVNDTIMMQQGLGDRIQWNPLDDAYPWVISHRLFPIALLDRDPRWCQIIAWECEVSEDLVREIIEIERNRA